MVGQVMGILVDDFDVITSKGEVKAQPILA
jgi:hypothetical protein